MDAKIVDVTPEDERNLRENSRKIEHSMSPENYLDFIQQYNEMLGHKQRRPAPIRGNFKL
jgi:hypothetical protein